MAVVMKIADDGDSHAPFVELFDDPRHSPGGIVVVDRDSHQFGSGAGQGSHLLDGRRHVCGVGVGHGLHHNGCIRAYPHTTHHGRNGLSSWNRSHIGEPLILSPNPARTGPPGEGRAGTAGLRVLHPIGSFSVPPRHRTNLSGRIPIVSSRPEPLSMRFPPLWF